MNDQLGGEVIEKFTFEQQSTNVVEMLDFTSRYFMQNSGGAHSDEKLLIIVSDGRGIFSQGRAQVAETIKRARARGIFIILIIIDNISHILYHHHLHNHKEYEKIDEYHLHVHEECKKFIEEVVRQKHICQFF